MRRPGRVSARARRHEDRAGDPLDGLVNLFDLGIVLSVGFLLAALSALDISPSALEQAREASTQRAPADAVVIEEDRRTRTIEVRPGEKVIGRGERLGEVYRLSDGRIVLVEEPKDER